MKPSMRAVSTWRSTGLPAGALARAAGAATSTARTTAHKRKDRIASVSCSSSERQENGGQENKNIFLTPIFLLLLLHRRRGNSRHLLLLRLRHVPQAYRLIFAGAGQRAAVGRKAGAEHQLLVADEQAALLHHPQVPQPHAAVGAARHRLGAV